MLWVITGQSATSTPGSNPSSRNELPSKRIQRGLSRHSATPTYASRPKKRKFSLLTAVSVAILLGIAATFWGWLLWLLRWVWVAIWATW